MDVFFDCSSMKSEQKQALVVVDFQNDFCSPLGKGAERRGDLSRLTRTARNIQRALRNARKNNTEVLFIQFIGDRKFQHRNLIDRDLTLGKKSKCHEGSWGAGFFR